MSINQVSSAIEPETNKVGPISAFSFIKLPKCLSQNYFFCNLMNYTTQKIARGLHVLISRWTIQAVLHEYPGEAFLGNFEEPGINLLQNSLFS